MAGLALALLLGVLLHPGGCAWGVREVRPEAFPAAAARLAVTPYRQQPERCGPHALAAVLTFLGKPVTAEELAPALYLPSVGGTLTMDMVLAATRRGVAVRQGEGSFAEARGDLDAGVPLILLLRYPALVGGAGHYVVATGYSAAPAGLFLLWGDGRESWVAEGDLAPSWARSGSWRLSFREGP